MSETCLVVTAGLVLLAGAAKHPAMHRAPLEKQTELSGSKRHGCTRLISLSGLGDKADMQSPCRRAAGEVEGQVWVEAACVLGCPTGSPAPDRCWPC